MTTTPDSLHGVVLEFDRAVGLGTIRADDATLWPFHCIEIADGTRDIAAGTRVRFETLAKFGTLQAAAVTAE